MQIESLTGETNGAFKVQIRVLNTLAGGFAASVLKTRLITRPGNPCISWTAWSTLPGGGVPMIGYSAGRWE